MNKYKKISAIIISFVLICIFSFSGLAVSYTNIPTGTYDIKASLSCFIKAMGGVEFGAPLMKGATLEVKASGDKFITIKLDKSQVTIYNVTCDTFIDASPVTVTEDETQTVKNGTIGIYDKSGKLITKDVTYTLSKGTAENSQQTQVHYVDSITFPISYESDIYNISLYVNSNVMGTQFTSDKYPATLKVDWSSVTFEENINTATTETTVTTQKETTTAVETTSSESNDGLNIYMADETEENVITTEQKIEEGIFAFFDEKVLLLTGVIALGIILVGVVFVVWGKQEAKNGKR